MELMTELKRRHGSMELGSHICSTATLKRPKIEPPVSSSIRDRKDKLGEKVSALQQLVSPFGKTDTASVLLEATEYIKFLQDQVQVSTSIQAINLLGLTFPWALKGVERPIPPECWQTTGLAPQSRKPGTVSCSN